MVTTSSEGHIDGEGGLESELTIRFGFWASTDVRHLLSGASAWFLFDIRI